MTTAVLSRHTLLRKWVDEIAELTQPTDIDWCDGSDSEWENVTNKLVDAGTFVRLAKKPNSFWCASNPSDVARAANGRGLKILQVWVRPPLGALSKCINM